MRRLVGPALVIVAALLPGLTSCSVRTSGPPPPPPASATTTEDVLGALGIGQIVADYAIVIDTSASMKDNGRYATVTAAVRDFVTALAPADRVTLITFDERPVVVDRGSPDQMLTAVGKLPAEPTGRFTDIGAAIDAGLREMSDTGPGRPGAVVLLSDGRTGPPDTSPYAEAGSSAWVTLADDGRALAGRVRGYAIPLANGETGAALLGSVLPGTTVLQLDGPELRNYLAALPTTMRLSAAAEKIRPDLAATVTATWDLPPPTADLSDPVPAMLELRSSARVLPLLVDTPAVAVSGADLRVGGLPDRVLVEPGSVTRIPVQISAAGGRTWLPGSSTTPVTAEMRVTGQVDTPWRTVVEKDLGLHTDLGRLDGPTTLGATRTTGLSWTLLGSVLGGLVAVLLAGAVRWARRHPRLTGHLDVERPDETVRAVELHGRVTSFDRPATPGDAGVRGRYTVRGVSSGELRGTLAVSYRAGGDHSSGTRTCRADEWVEIGGMLLRYRRG